MPAAATSPEHPPELKIPSQEARPEHAAHSALVSWLHSPIATVLLAAVGRAALERWTGSGPPFVSFVAAVLVSAWFRGLRAGLYTTAISLIAGWYCFVRPGYVWLKGDVDTAVRMFLFSVVGVVMSIACDRVRRAQRQELLAETRFRRTFENAAVGVAHLSLDGRWIWVNRRLCVITGYDAGELTARPVNELVVAHSGVPDDFVSTALAGCSFERQWRRKNGERVWVNMSLAIQRDVDDQGEYLIAVVEDISARKRAEESLRVNLLQLQATFDGMVEPALLVGPRAEVMAINEAFMSLFELTAIPQNRADVMRGLEFKLRDGSPLPPRETPYTRALRGEVVRDLELTLRNLRTGRVQHILTGAAPVHDDAGAVMAVVVTCHDITERRRAEQLLERSNEVLRQFAYAAAHDLQEPLRNVGLSSEMLVRRYSGALDDTGQQLLRNNIEGAQRMQRMVRDLLEYAKVIDFAPAAPPVCPVDEVLKDLLGNLRESIAETGADISFQGLPALRMERTHLLQLLQNLIGNSLRYRRSDVPPRVVVSAEQRAGETVICVSDNGIGFDPAHARRIFGLFRRLHGNAEYPGTGIGLALCERIVEHYGGRIWAESKPGAGARFYFSVPHQRG